MLFRPLALAGLLVRCVPPLVAVGLLPAAHGSLVPATSEVLLEWNANPEPDIRGYRVYYGTESGVYDQVVDVGNQTQAVLSELPVGPTHYCVLTAYNTLGLESGYSRELAFDFEIQPDPSNPLSRLILLDMAGAVDEPAAGGDCPDDGFDPLRNTLLRDFEVAVDAFHVIWCRVRAAEPGSGGFHFSLDGAPAEGFHAPSGAGCSADGWFWVGLSGADAKLRRFLLAEGPHVLRLQPWEACEVDRLVLSSDPNFVPTDDLPCTGDAVSIILSPAGRTLSAGQSTTFTVTAVGTAELAYQWYRNGVPLADENARSLEIPHAAAGDSGDYHVTVWSGLATASSGPAVLEVVTTPPALRIMNLTVTPERSVSLDVDATPGTTLSVYASSDMVCWSLLGKCQNTTGTITIDDPAAQSSPRRFYRLSVGEK